VRRGKPHPNRLSGLGHEPGAVLPAPGAGTAAGGAVGGAERGHGTEWFAGEGGQPAERGDEADWPLRPETGHREARTTGAVDGADQAAAGEQAE